MSSEQPPPPGSDGNGSQMANMWNKFKAGASSAATSAQVAAEKTKLTAEMSLLQNKVKAAKKDLGLQIYDPMASSDTAEVSRIFGASKATIDSLEAQIADKKNRIAALDQQR